MQDPTLISALDLVGKAWTEEQDAHRASVAGGRVQCARGSYILMGWRGKPLVSLETIVNLISSTTASTGLEIYARLDEGAYPDKIRVSDQQFDTTRLHGDAFHPEWNSTIKPPTS
jgi:hypothetical protein